MHNQISGAKTSASAQFTTLLLSAARQRSESIACDDTAEFQINAENRSACMGMRRVRSAATLRAFVSLILAVGAKNSKAIEKSGEPEGSVRCYRLHHAGA